MAQVVNCAPGEVRRQCPYDPSHSSGLSSIGNHIVNCHNQYVKKMIASGMPEEAFAVADCQFNHRHSRIPVKQLKYHETYCEDRDRKVGENEDGWKNFIPKKSSEPLNVIWETNDNWDDDEEFHFSVHDKLQKEFVFRQPSGLTKSEKADFKEAQRKRVLQLKRPPGLMVSLDNDEEEKEIKVGDIGFVYRSSRSRRNSVASSSKNAGSSIYYDTNDGSDDDLFYDLADNGDEDEGLFEDALENIPK